jgi:hypothetical protein
LIACAHGKEEEGGREGRTCCERHVSSSSDVQRRERKAKSELKEREGGREGGRERQSQSSKREKERESARAT